MIGDRFISEHGAGVSGPGSDANRGEVNDLLREATIAAELAGRQMLELLMPHVGIHLTERHAKRLVNLEIARVKVGYIASRTAISSAELADRASD